MRLPGRRMIVAHAFPSTDREFATAVSRALEDERARTNDIEELRDAVAARIRRSYPNTRIVGQSTLGQILPQETWYVFRDAAVRRASVERERLYASLATSRHTLAKSRDAMGHAVAVAERAGKAMGEREPTDEA